MIYLFVAVVAIGYENEYFELWAHNQDEAQAKVDAYCTETYEYYEVLCVGLYGECVKYAEVFERHMRGVENDTTPRL